MSEQKNVILAIALSLAVLLGWQYFFAYPQVERQRQEAVLKKQEQAQPGAPAAGGSKPAQPAGPAPNVPSESAPAGQTSSAERETVLAASPRVTIQTPRLRGSINLKGGRIDDLSLEQYREAVDPNSPPIVLLAPSGAPDAFYAEFGWVPTSGAPAKVPGADTLWQQQGSGPLTVGHPVTLTYDNGEGLLFRRTIAVDDHYLFTVKDEVQNKGSSPATLFPYALISRHGTPKVLGYYILHEGLIGMMGDQGLQEETYKKIEDKKSESWDVTDAWLGITDKYFAATLIPATDAKVKTRYSASTVD